MAEGRKILILAGPNGAGKTSIATEFLPHEEGCLAFVNADSIAAGLSPFAQSSVTFRAGRLLLETINEHTANEKSFAFETTLSGRGYSRSIPKWREQGHFVKLFYLRLSDPKLAATRVEQRVSEGGHDVPESVIRRRYQAGWTNFENTYRGLVDEWRIYDNSGPELVLLGSGSQRTTTTSISDTTRKPEHPEPDSDLDGVKAASRRAAQNAYRRAAFYGSKVAIVENNKIVLKTAEPVDPTSSKPPAHQEYKLV